MAALLAVCIAGGIAGCGGSGSPDVTPAEVTLSVRPEGSPEERVLGEIYAQALKGAGYNVKKVPKPSFGLSTNLEAVKDGQISGYPERLSTALYYDFGLEGSDIPADAQTAYEKAKARFEKQGLIAFPPAPFTVANAVGMLRKTAEERGLKTDSDLKGKAEEMTIHAETYCHVSLDCLGGIERYYGTAFESVSYEPSITPVLRFSKPQPNLRYEVLENGEFDASMLFTTEGRLAAEGDKFVILEDDKHVFPAGNPIWVTSPEVIEEAGPEYERAIVRAQRGLTLSVMRELNARVELEKQSPAKAAAAYLSEAGYTG
jgi:glycine betaine/choline ABC-type transport system substrate-binding protein